MVGADYTVYRRSDDGRRGDQVENFTALKIEQRWGEPGKWMIESSGLSRVPFEIGQGIIIYRDGVEFFSGIVETIEESCDEAQGGIINWVAEGRDLTILLERRLALPDPVDLRFDETAADVIVDSADGAIRRYVERNGGESAAAGRHIMNLQIEGVEPDPDGQMFAMRLKKLDGVCEEIGKGELIPVINQDAETGAMTLSTVSRRERADEVVFAVEFGTVLNWTRKRQLPKMNAVWAAGGGEGTDRIVVFAKSDDSISAYGRFEGFLSDTVKAQEATGDKPAITADDVTAILTEKAEEALRTGAALDSFSVEVREGPRAVFQTDWRCGDRVSCVIDGERIISTIDSVSIDYTVAGEQIQAVIGKIEKGIFSELFSRIVEIQKGLETEETK